MLKPGRSVPTTNAVFSPGASASRVFRHYRMEIDYRQKIRRLVSNLRIFCL